MSKKHSVYSASGSERWLNCPASIREEAKYPEQPESPYAEEGTRAHEVLESFLVKRHGADLRKDFKDKKLYPDDMIAIVRQTGEEILMLLEDIGGELVVERKVSLEHIEKGMFGTLDVAIVDPFNLLVVIDFKYGAGIPVEVTDNSQFGFYGLAAAHENDYNFLNIRTVVMQPRADHPQGTTRIEQREMKPFRREWEKKFKDGVAATKKKDAPHVPGDHCRWCRAKSGCPALTSKALAPVSQSAATKLQSLLPKVGKLEPKKIPELLEACDALETWIKEIREQSFRLISDGKKIPGYKLVPKRASRQWVDRMKAETLALKKFGDKAFQPAEIISPAQLEKLKGGKEFVAKYAVAISSGMTMAPETDSREEFNILKNEFSDLTKGGKRAK